MKSLSFSTSQRVFLSIFLLILVNVIFYMPTLRGDLVLDDRHILLSGQLELSPSRTAAFFTRGSLVTIPGGGESTPVYRPLWILLLAAGHELWNTNPLGYHLVSLILHIACSILFWVILGQLMGQRTSLGLLTGALISSIHPAKTEAVAWISAICHLQAACFTLLSLMIYIKQVRRNKGSFFIFPALFFLCAVMSQESAIVCPLMLISCHLVLRQRISVRFIGTFVVSLAAYLLLRHHALRVSVPFAITSSTGWLNLVFFLSGYLRSLVLPWPQFVDFLGYSIQLIGSDSIVIALLMIAGFIVMWLKAKTMRSYLMFSTCWLLLSLLPFLYAAFSSRPVFAFRFLYLPSCCVGIWVACAVAISRETRLLMGCIVLIAGACFVGIDAASHPWQNEKTLYEKIVQDMPEHPGALYELGGFFHRQKDIQNALTYFNLSAEAAEGSQKAKALIAIGQIYGQSGNAEKSIASYKEALKHDPNRAEAWIGLGNNDWLKGNLSGALENYGRAIKTDRTNWRAYYNMSLVFQKMGDDEKSQRYRKAAEMVKEGKAPILLQN